MWIFKLPHAGMIVGTASTKIVMDPLFTSSLNAGVFSVAPSFKLETRSIAKIDFDAIIISHEHLDHFCLESLHVLNRDIDVYYPSGDMKIPSILRSMGFLHLNPVDPERSFKVGDIEVVPILSEQAFPELGFIFKNGNDSVWNLVDALPKQSTIQRLTKRWGRAGILFAFYQCFQEAGVKNLRNNGAFPIDQYEQLLSFVRWIRPKVVVPSSCDLTHELMPWLNGHLFPITPERFLRDIQSSSNEIKGFMLNPGETCHFKNDRIRKSSKPILPLHFKTRPALVNRWLPDAGLPKLKNYSFYPTNNVKQLRQEVLQFLRGPFLQTLQTNWEHARIQRLRQQKVLWKLRLDMPDDKTLEFYLDFSREPHWIKMKKEPQVDLETVIAASSLLGFVHGYVPPYAISSGGLMRMIDRRICVKKWKVSASTGPQDRKEPLEILFTARSLELYWMRKLQKLGCSVGN